MLRVLHVIAGLDASRGGPSTALTGLATALARAGAGVSVVSFYDQRGIPLESEPLRAAGVTLKLFGPVRSHFGSHPQLRRSVEDAVADADVVHIHGLWEEIQHRAAVAARRLGKPYIFRPCGMLDPWSLRQKWLKKQVYMTLRLRRDLNAASALHFASDMERDGAARLGLKPKAIIEPLGIDWAEFDPLPRRGSFRERYPQLANRPLIVFLGRIHPGKGLELLVPALAQAGGDAALAIVGPGDSAFRRQVESEVERHGLGDRVIFTGMLRGAQRIAALRDADLFALPSYHENFGLVVIEALACGVPVLISNEVGLHRAISEAQVGAVIPTRVAPLAAELKRWVGDAALRAEAAARARRFVRESYDWNRIAERWIEHYQRLLAARGPKRSCTTVS